MSVTTDDRGTWKEQLEYKRPRAEITLSGIRDPNGNPQASITVQFNLGEGNLFKKVVKTINQENKTESNFVIQNAYMVNIYKKKALLNLILQSATTDS